MNREELIDLRKQVQKVIEDGSAFPADVLSAQIVLVFEQAHTPTDDEREAVEDALWDVVERLSLPLTGVEVQTLAESVARRTVQGEPTDDEREALVINYCPEHGDLLDGPRSIRCNEAHTVEDIRRTVQGEPALIECPHWSPGKITMRKGCTACAAVQGEPSAEAEEDLCEWCPMTARGNAVWQGHDRPRRSCGEPGHGEFFAADAEPQGEPTDALIEDALWWIGQAWDDGNGSGLDGWIGPGRGAGEIDREAQHARTRMVHKAEAALRAAARVEQEGEAR